jgi:hypothetical protein
MAFALSGVRQSYKSSIGSATLGNDNHIAPLGNVGFVVA